MLPTRETLVGEVGELVLALVWEEQCSGCPVMQSACGAGGAKMRCGPWPKLGDPAFYFALDHLI